MRVALLVLLVGLICVPAGAAKEGKGVVVIGSDRRAVVEPFAGFAHAFEQVGLGASVDVPSGPYLLVFPLMEDEIPMRPGRWYPDTDTLCSGWQTGIEAGCVMDPQLRGWFGKPKAGRLFRGDPTVLASLSRRHTSLPASGNAAAAIEMSLSQAAQPGSPPAGCVPFGARWRGPLASGRPTLFCVSLRGGLYAAGNVYPLPSQTAEFVTS